MKTKEKIINSLASVIASPKYVFIDENRIKEFAQEIFNVSLPAWDNTLQLRGNPEETAYYYFFLDSLNFCFWAPKNKSRWQYKIENQWIGGYYAFSRAIKDAFLEDKRLFDAEYLSTISEDDFNAIFNKGRNELLLLKERQIIIRENFSILKERFKGKAVNLLVRAQNNADKLVELLIKEFSSFRDIQEWQGKKLYFLKRAQIFASDLSFSGVESLKIANLENLTIFADYKLPQIFESAGILKYSKDLERNIRNENLIPAGSLKEIEIRASLIFAAEKIRDELEKLGRNITTQELDWILWVQAKKRQFKKPHHKTLTTFY